MNTIENAIVCSFYTDDEYYRSHGTRLRENLEELGMSYDLREIAKQPGEDWATICRKKVGFIDEVCDANPGKKVFWIDVDCELFSVPDFILNSTADIIGFQRGFSNPLKIGYERRGRFWEPCFWGINTTPQARKMVKDAAEFEQLAEVRATDDFFFEEAWRANAKNMTFQIIPSNCAVDKGIAALEGKEVFFRFGSSGQVGNFKNKVQQHKGYSPKKSIHLKLRALRVAKYIEAHLPESISLKLRLLVDASGVTGFLTGKTKSNPIDRSMNEILIAGKKGDLEKYQELLGQFNSSHLPNSYERSALNAASSYLAYAAKSSKEKIAISWWEKPFPGNFGDWLTPFIFSHYTGKKLIFQGLTVRSSNKHIVGLGSVGRFIKSKSVVVGTGVSSTEHALNKYADYISVRGPHTAALLQKSGGPDVKSFGDPAIVLSRILPITKGPTNGRIALVRHHTHLQVPIKLPGNFDELSVKLSHPDEIVSFIKKLHQYESVVTSAMHVMITCQSYGIPCALVVFKGFEEYVHGSGIKYSDYSLGAGLPEINPVVINPKFDMNEIRPLIQIIKVSEGKIDEVESAIKLGLSRFDAE